LRSEGRAAGESLRSEGRAAEDLERWTHGEHRRPVDAIPAIPALLPPPATSHPALSPRSQPSCHTLVPSRRPLARIRRFVAKEPGRGRTRTRVAGEVEAPQL
jgi:hypothetical protein